MSSEILLINPGKRRKKRSTKRRRKTTTATRKARSYAAPRRRRRRKTATTFAGVKPMAKKRRSRKTRRNPSASPARRTYGRAISRAKQTFSGLNVRGALTNLPLTLVGMFASKWAAKRFGEGGAIETDNESWGWANYLKGAVGGVAAAFLMQNFRPGSGQKVLEGALSLMAYQIVQRELIPQSEWATNQFGAETVDAQTYEPGDVDTDAQGTAYMLGEDYQWHALPETTMGEQLQPVGPLGLGEDLQPVGPLGSVDDKYRQALLGN